jgi:hypothetical protein
LVYRIWPAIVVRQIRVHLKAVSFVEVSWLHSRAAQHSLARYQYRHFLFTYLLYLVTQPDRFLSQFRLNNIIRFSIGWLSEMINFGVGLLDELHPLED